VEIHKLFISFPVKISDDDDDDDTNADCNLGRFETSMPKNRKFTGEVITLGAHVIDQLITICKNFYFLLVFSKLGPITINHIKRLFQYKI